MLCILDLCHSVISVYKSGQGLQQLIRGWQMNRWRRRRSILRRTPVDLLIWMFRCWSHCSCIRRNNKWQDIREHRKKGGIKWSASVAKQKSWHGRIKTEERCGFRDRSNVVRSSHHSFSRTSRKKKLRRAWSHGRGISQGLKKDED
jgi:hypothetical protein